MNGILSFPPTLPISLMILAGKATLLLALVFIIRLMVRTASASTRYFLISASIIMIGCLPLLTWITPDWKVPLPAIIQRSVVSDPAPSPSPEILSGILKTEPSKAIMDVTETHAFPAAAASGNLLLCLWLLGTLVAAGRVLIGMAGCARNQRQAKEPDSQRIHELIKSASHKIGLRKEISAGVGDQTEAPYISGIIKPVLSLPRDVIRWPEQRLMSVLLHELAHIKRGDHFLWPLANLAVSWLWFNPLVWLALAQMRKDKERACDDYVLACGRSRIGYAQHLLEACLSLRTSVKLAPIGLQFAQKNEVKERIIYMLNQKINHQPMGKVRQLAFIFLMVVVLIPLTGITGFSTAVTSSDVSPGEHDAVTATLKAFFAELSNGSDYQVTRERFLTSDYFDDPSLTLENLDQAVWMPVFDNTLCCITEGRPGVVDKIRNRMTSLRREGNELVASLQIDVVGYCLNGKSVRRNTDSSTVILVDDTSGKKTAISECHVAHSLTQEIRFRLENGAWKVSRFNDGMAIMRMDTNNPYGPIFLVWVENIDEQTTPFGARVFKVIPRDIVPNAHNAQFVLEE